MTKSKKLSEEQHDMKKNYFFNMDGVLATYDRDAYIGQNPLFLQPHVHYFRNLEPDMKMLSVMDGLWSYIRCHRLQDEIYIITSIANNGALFNEHLHDKLEWVSKWIPYFPIDHVFACVSSKRDIFEMISNRKLIPNHDILIDDYNKNLIEWREADGTAIKYLNGINSSESWDGKKVHHNADKESIIQSLITI